MKKQEILKVLNSNPQLFPSIARKLKINKNDNTKLSTALNDLVVQGEIFTTRDRKYVKPQFLYEVEGSIRLSTKGFGFIVQEEGPSIFIGPNSTSNSFDKDIVLAKVYQDPQDVTKCIGAVLKIIERKTTILIGMAKKYGEQWGFETIDGSNQSRYKFIDTKGLKEDFIIKVKIVEFKDKVTILKQILTIGHKDDASVDIQATIEQSGISWIFPKAVLDQANKIPSVIDNEDKRGRKDIRNRMVVTIDGDDTKDFDDAVEITKLKNGNYVLGVHIADVTHYVKEGSPMDQEALLRGTSVYLADRVIPMLPEKLSNGICSLNPHVDRFVLSCDMEINPKGETVSYEVYPSIINSKHRLTYNDVNDYYAGDKSFDDKELETMLNIVQELTNKIRAFKKSEGYIDFEIEEAKLILDENGKTIDIVPRPRGISEMMIEDFMVRANETVAEHAFNKELAFIYRVHDRPEMERTAALTEVLKTLGLNLSIPENPEPIEFAKVIEDLKRERFDDFLKIMMLRTMSKAVYQKDNIGHFGLASKCYTHFTSPIRRYPDLMVHRMLRTYFFEKKPNMSQHFDNILDQIAKDNSAAEQKAVELERKVSDIKKAEFFEQFVGQKMTGQIVSMAKFGFFVEFPSKVDGLVHITTLTDGNYELATNGFKLKSDKRTITIGDTVEVVVVKTSKSEGKIDLVLADLVDKQAPAKSRRPQHGKGNSKK